MEQAARQTKYAGIHIIADFFGGKRIESSVMLQKLLCHAARKGSNKPLEFVSHEFFPQGITGVMLLAESHIAVHTWPELSYIAVDIFTCGEKSKPEKALKFLREALRPKNIRVQRIKRGLYANAK